MLEGNRRFKKEEFTEDLDHYPAIAAAQKPKALFIDCADSRIEPCRITGTRAGDLFSIRNVGNIIPPDDPGIATVLEFAITRLKAPEILLCGHSRCASIRALDWPAGDGSISRWLVHARLAQERVDNRISPPTTPAEEDERYRLIEEENVRLQIEHLLTYPVVRRAVDANQLRIHGLYYDLLTGALTPVR
ncbi:MAG: carbonic anhydrase [Methanoregula sp.]|nr:carbonic anhydrase [Methanoregula sp.]PKG31063.1 MAG: carbonic anhydrase [Methanoregula sp.]